MEDSEQLSRGDIAVVADPNRPNDTWEMVSLETQSGERIVLANTETLWPEPMKRLDESGNLIWTGMRYLVLVDVIPGEGLEILAQVA